MAQSLYDRLERWDDFPPAWRPVPGEILVGTVEGYDTWEGKYGAVKVAFLRDAAGGALVGVYLSSTVLLEEFRKVRPRVGEKIGIRYLGKDEEKGYHKFKVMIEREMNVEAFLAGEGLATPDDDDVPL